MQGNLMTGSPHGHKCEPFVYLSPSANLLCIEELLLSQQCTRMQKDIAAKNHISEKSNIIFAQQGTFYLETDSDKTT